MSLSRWNFNNLKSGTKHSSSNALICSFTSKPDLNEESGYPVNRLRENNKDPDCKNTISYINSEFPRERKIWSDCGMIHTPPPGEAAKIEVPFG